MRHAFTGALSRVFVFTVLVLALAVPLAAQAQDLGASPSGTLTTGVPWLDKTLVALSAIGAVCSLLSHFVSANSVPGQLISWAALNFGKNLAAKKPASITELRPGGFARVWALALIAVASLFIATAAHAQDAAPAPSPVTAPAPAPVAAPAEVTPAPITPTIGGCFAKGKWCVGPTVALTLTAINLTSKHVEAGFAPGVGVGITYQKGTWSSIGLGAYFALVPGSQGVPDNASGALIASFLNGWGRVGVSKGFIGDTSTRLLVGTGLDL